MGHSRLDLWICGIFLNTHNKHYTAATKIHKHKILCLCVGFMMVCAVYICFSGGSGVAAAAKPNVSRSWDAYDVRFIYIHTNA